MRPMELYPLLAMVSVALVGAVGFAANKCRSPDVRWNKTGRRTTLRSS